MNIITLTCAVCVCVLKVSFMGHISYYYCYYQLIIIITCK